MRKFIILSSFIAVIVIYSFASPIIGGFSIDTPFLPLSVQPYSLYYYPGIGYDVGYGMSGQLNVGVGFTIKIPWMNFSQLPIESSDLPVAIAIAKAESAFQNYSLSSAGAQGLMQFLPTTAPAFGVQNTYDPFQSVAGAMSYIKQYVKQFNSLKLAIAAYNAGPGAVSYYNGIPPYPETQAYVSQVMNYISQYSSGGTYPDIYARLGIFAQYDYFTSFKTLGNLTIGLAYPLPPGQMDICPEVTIVSSSTGLPSVNVSWIWRVNVMNGVYFALDHTNQNDEVELSGVFGPLTAVVGSYSNGIGASGILDLWSQRIFGSISQSGAFRYGVAFHVYKVYLDLWSENNPSSSASYNLSLNGRW